VTASLRSILAALALLLAACTGGADLLDFDGDGTPDLGDCEPDDPAVHPDSQDDFGDGIDADCSGEDGTDHAFGLEIDGAPVASTGTKGGFDVRAKGKEIVTYGFTIDLGPDGLGRAFGKDAEFAFTAEADLDLPGVAGEALEGVLGEISEGLGEGLGDGVVSNKLTFGHAGRIKLARPPTLTPPDDGTLASVPLVGTSETMNLGTLLGELGEAGEPIIALLDILQGAAVNHEIELPVGAMLEQLGVPAELTGGAISALNAFLAIQGQDSIGSRNSSVTIPVDLPPLSTLIAAVDPNAAAKIADFEASWEDFSTGTLGLDGGLMIPAALPSGMRVAAPFVIQNPNEFALSTPGFQLAIVDADGQPVAAIGAVPTDGSLSAPGATSVRTVGIGAAGTQGMQLISEIHWDKLTGGLLEAAVTGAAAPSFEGDEARRRRHPGPRLRPHHGAAVDAPGRSDGAVAGTPPSGGQWIGLSSATSTGVRRPNSMS